MKAVGLTVTRFASDRDIQKKLMGGRSRHLDLSGLAVH
jgi:hypothetical protein